MKSAQIGQEKQIKVPSDSLDEFYVTSIEEQSLFKNSLYSREVSIQERSLFKSY